MFNPSSPYQLTRQKFLSPIEVDSLERILGRFMILEPRNCILISLGLATGARAQELLNLQAHDLNDADRAVFFKGLKGSRDRELPIKRDLYNLMRQHLPESGLLFPISYGRLHQIWGAYRPAKKTFHSLRHTFAIRLYERTKDLRLVQMALGHRRITNTMVYAEYSYTAKEFRRLIG